MMYEYMCVSRCLALSWTSARCVNILNEHFKNIADANVMVVASDVCYHTRSSRSLGELIGGVVSQWNAADIKSKTSSGNNIAGSGNKRGCRVVLSHTVRYSLGSEDDFDEPLYSFLLECERRNLGARILNSVCYYSSPLDNDGARLAEDRARLQSPMGIARMQQNTSIVMAIESI